MNPGYNEPKVNEILPVTKAALVFFHFYLVDIDIFDITNSVNFLNFPPLLRYKEITLLG